MNIYSLGPKFCRSKLRKAVLKKGSSKGITKTDCVCVDSMPSKS